MLKQFRKQFCLQKSKYLILFNNPTLIIIKGWITIYLDI